MLDDVSETKAFTEKNIHLEEPFEILGTYVNGIWLPFRTDTKVFLLNMRNQEKIIIETGADRLLSIKGIIGRLNGGLLIISHANDVTTIRAAKLEKNEDEQLACKISGETPLTINGLYHWYEVSPEGHWLRLEYFQKDRQMGELRNVTNYLLSLIQEPLAAIKLTSSQTGHAGRPVSFISDTHLCVLGRDYLQIGGFNFTPVGFPVYSLEPFTAGFAANKTEPMMEKKLENMLGYIPGLEEIERIKYVARQGFKISPDGRWLGLHINSSNRMQLRIYLMNGGQLTFHAQFAADSDPKWLADNTLIFHMARDFDEMEAGVYQYDPALKTCQQLLLKDKPFTAVNSRDVIWRESAELVTLRKWSEAKEETPAAVRVAASVIRLAIANSPVPKDESGDTYREYARRIGKGIPGIHSLFDLPRLTSKLITSIHGKLVALVSSLPQKSYAECVTDIFTSHQVTEAQCKMHPELYAQIQSVRALDKGVSLMQLKSRSGLAHQ